MPTRQPTRATKATALPSAVTRASGPRQALTVQASARPARPSHGYWAARTIASSTLVVTAPAARPPVRKGLTVAQLKALVRRTAIQAPAPKPHPYPLTSNNIHRKYPATPSLSPYIKCSK